MFRNLTAGQWAVFILLTCFTIFGGLVYLIAEAYFARQDRAFAATPVGREYLAQEQAAKADAEKIKAQEQSIRPWSWLFHSVLRR